MIVDSPKPKKQNENRKPLKSQQKNKLNAANKQSDQVNKSENKPTEESSKKRKPKIKTENKYVPNVISNKSEWNKVIIEPIHKQYSSQLDEFRKALKSHESRKALEIAYSLHAKAKMLHDIYDESMEVYLRGVICMAQAHFSNGDFQISEKHFKKVFKWVTQKIQDEPDSEKIKSLLKDSSIGMLMIYSQSKQYNRVKHILDILEEEGTEYSSLDERVLIAIIHAEKLFSEKLQTRALQELDVLLGSIRPLDKSEVDTLTKIRLIKIRVELLVAEKQISKAIHELDAGIKIAKHHTGKHFEVFILEHLELYYTKIKILTHEQEEKTSLGVRATELIEEAWESARFILMDQFRPLLNDSNQLKFFSPLRKYIVYLSKAGKISEALGLLETLITQEREFLGNFNVNLGKSYDLRGKLSAKQGQLKKALDSYQSAYSIFSEVGEKEASEVTLKKISDIEAQLKEKA